MAAMSLISCRRLKTTWGSGERRKHWHKYKSATFSFFFILRFFSNYFASGMGFQLEYESTNVSQWSYGSGACGGNFTSPNGIITSPSYPDNYPTTHYYNGTLYSAVCIYTISQPTGTLILLNFLSFDLYDYGSVCDSYDDNLEIRDGPSFDSPLLARLCGTKIPDQIQTSQNQLWMKWG